MYKLFFVVMLLVAIKFYGPEQEYGKDLSNMLRPEEILKQ